jgi:hypothetical protein
MAFYENDMFRLIFKIQIQVQVEAIVRLLANTEMSFVFCFVPHHLAGMSSL